MWYMLLMINLLLLVAVAAIMWGLKDALAAATSAGYWWAGPAVAVASLLWAIWMDRKSARLPPRE